jgi:serine/threonine-protein kinase RsbW
MGYERVFAGVAMAEETQGRCEFESKKLILRFETKLPADLDAFSPVVDGVMKIVREMGCAAGDEDAVELAIHEALSNAIRHGCKNNPSKQVQFCVSCDESRGMLIVVRDPGEGFDPASVPSPIVGERIYLSHGRGIFLINQLMDSVRFERGGTEIYMLKK